MVYMTVRGKIARRFSGFKYAVIKPDTVVIKGEGKTVAYRYKKVKRYMKKADVNDPINWDTIDPPKISDREFSKTFLMGNELFYAIKVYEKFVLEG